MWARAPRKVEQVTVGLLTLIFALCTLAALGETGAAQSVFFFSASVAAGGVVGRWRFAFTSTARRAASDADFDG